MPACEYCGCVTHSAGEYKDTCLQCGARQKGEYTELRASDTELVVIVYQVGETYDRDKLNARWFDTEKAMVIHQIDDNSYVNHDSVDRPLRSQTFRGQDELNVNGFNFYGEMGSEVMLFKPKYVRIGREKYHIVSEGPSQRVEAVTHRDQFSTLSDNHY